MITFLMKNKKRYFLIVIIHSNILLITIAFNDDTYNINAIYYYNIYNVMSF